MCSLVTVLKSLKYGELTFNRSNSLSVYFLQTLILWWILILCTNNVNQIGIECCQLWKPTKNYTQKFNLKIQLFENYLKVNSEDDLCWTIGSKGIKYTILHLCAIVVEYKFHQIKEQQPLIMGVKGNNRKSHAAVSL